MVAIRPQDLSPVDGGIVNPDAAIIADVGYGVRRATPAQVVDAGAPVSSQAEAEAGVVNTGRMTPLRVKQAIDALGVSADVLASPIGAGMIGLPNGTVADAIKWVTPQMFGAVGDGSTDDSNALIAMFAEMANVGAAYIPSATYKVTKPLSIPPAVLMGGDVVLDFSTANIVDFPGDTACVTVSASARTQIANIDTDLAIGDATFSFAAAHGKVAGDTLNLAGTVAGAGNGYRPVYTKGEMFRIARVVDSTTLIMENGCRDTYPFADVEVWARPGDQFTQGCASLRVISTDAISYAVRFLGLDRSVASNIHAEGAKVSAIDFTDCYGMFADNISARQTVAPANGYGISVSNCQGAVLNGEAYGRFNGFTVGGDNPIGGIIGMNRDIHFKGTCGSDPVNGLSGGNFHGNTEYSSLRGVFFNGVVLAGDKNEAHGTFIGLPGWQAVIFGEMHGHTFNVTGIARTIGATLTTGSGAIHQTGAGTFLRYGGKTTIKVQLYSENATRMVLWRMTALTRTDVSLNLAVDIMKGHATTRFMALTANSGNALPAIDFNGFAVTDNAVAITWSMDAGTKLRNMVAAKTVTVTGTGVTTATAPVTFNPGFPRAPQVNVGPPAPPFVGTKLLVAGGGSITTTGATITVYVADNTPQNINSTVTVTAMLNEQ